MKRKNKKINLIVFVDRKDLGASIDSIHWGKIKPVDLEKDTVKFIMDNMDSLEIENLEELDEDAQKEAAISKFLKDGIIWGRNNDSQLSIIKFNVAAIKGKRQQR